MTCSVHLFSIFLLFLSRLRIKFSINVTEFQITCFHFLLQPAHICSAHVQYIIFLSWYLMNAICQSMIALIVNCSAHGRAVIAQHSGHSHNLSRAMPIIHRNAIVLSVHDHPVQFHPVISSQRVTALWQIKFMTIKL